MTDSLIIAKMIVKLIIHMGQREEVGIGDSGMTQLLAHKLTLLPMK